MLGHRRQRNRLLLCQAAAQGSALLPVFCLGSASAPHNGDTRWGDLQHERIHVSLDGATEDMNLWLVEEDKGISGGFKYDPDLFLADSISALRDRFVRLLEDGLRRPDQSLAKLLAPSPAELSALSDWESQAVAPAVSGIATTMGGTPAANAEANAGAWETALAFVRRHGGLTG